jgi:hypothetical protein
MRILYIAGATRSGSTLFHDLISQVDGFEGVGELRDIWQYGLLDNRLCGCGVRFRSCGYWSDVLADAFGSGEAVGEVGLAEMTERFRTRDLLVTTRRRRTHRIAELGPLLDALARVCVSVQRTTGCRVIVDSSKNPAFGYLVANHPDLDVHVVHLIRDAPAVAYSLSKRKESEPGRRLPRKTSWESSADWVLRNLAADLHLRHRPLIRVRYEDLLRDPAATIRAVCDLVDEPDVDLGFLSADEIPMAVRPHSVFGNPGRFRHGPTRLAADDEWVSRMDWREVATVKALTLPLRRRYGYTGPAAPPGDRAPQ